MIKVWNMFWSMILTAFTAADDTVATVGIAAKVARDEATGTADVLAIDRGARIAARTAAAQALVAEFTAPAEQANAK